MSKLNSPLSGSIAAKSHYDVDLDARVIEFELTSEFKKLRNIFAVANSETTFQTVRHLTPSDDDYNESLATGESSDYVGSCTRERAKIKQGLFNWIKNNLNGRTRFIEEFYTLADEDEVAEGESRLDFNDTVTIYCDDTVDVRTVFEHVKSWIDWMLSTINETKVTISVNYVDDISVRKSQATDTPITVQTITY